MIWHIVLNGDDRVNTIVAAGELKQSPDWTYVIDDGDIICCVPNARIIYISKGGPNSTSIIGHPEHHWREKKS